MKDIKENLKNAFLKGSLLPEANLADDIWKAVIKRNQRIVYSKLITLSLTGFVSLYSLAPAFRMLALDFSQSGFYEYLSLTFSSGGSIVAYWKDFLLLLAESLPVMSILLFLMLVFVFFLSLKYAIKQIVKGQLSLSL
ncbi:hypothetical protein A2641_01125 [Candidatus Nomurabacteria bacterium RIFCSPHIGHO2_01_FULL_37_25]|uniref:Uncharacterized protein n=1 Tax=Candidatus Nomurabacteria bacterium RIFCSPLOWO2_01_FULL_36_16 TaxID=1801767 RepID=A0A1F6WYW9_9BACT|nr:MAG: hypothetical protein A2641_01125 [Candidatus Nomurabacteria bacterium RIFCSPHIGHO2_01_FULL_37_25]OGI75321.1 MAG: hypothetical protein A3D36_02025 [Candidatus Nomurabacteria bacterium RIFCSPHIGHO2_02_FULL_36_29]OGI87068.1 MAG: hypothetical protein A3A91_00120 [Candidatus Nomurabacteria bacterium RIFCSPLOWO2_01_FULL_36_16]OGI95933.1 MAG: hypothetical protein A3I84_01280 [Candidatus Nomurabacteria bacterium RIFCSPLOWO2_02_FULL_36_8]